MDRAKAKSMTRTVQTVAVLLVAATAAAALVPLSVKAEPVADTAAAPPPKPAPAQAPKVEIETASASMFLDKVSGPVKNQPPVPGPDENLPPVEVAKTGVDSWRYLGGIISSDYKRAIVVIDEHQRLFAEGQTVDDVQIVEIDKSFIKVKQGETETTINIAPRHKPVLTLLDPAAAARAANGGVAQPIANPAAARAAMSGNAVNGGGAAATVAGKARQRDLERRKADAKAKGDERGAEMLDAELGGLGKEGKGEKGQK